MSTPAVRLLAAADLLEKRAGDATPGPWILGLHRDGQAVGIDAHDGETDVVQDIQMGLGDAHYIATMHPEVGKLLAASLREAAHTIDGNARLMAQGRPMINIASAFLLDLADLLLAGAL